MSLSKSRSALMIPVGLAIPVYVAPEEIGQSVFQEFLHYEFEHERLSDDILNEDGGGDMNGFIDQNFGVAHRAVFQSRQSSSDLANTPEGYKSILISQVGTNIRELANEFARSRQRNAVRKEADEVDLGALTFDRFFGLLEEVFRQGITRYNLIALFYFCSDVLIRCIRRRMRDLGMNLFRWALRYVTTQVCSWVTEQGGWERVIHNTVQNTKKYFVAAAYVIVISAIGWLAFKALKK